MKKLLILLTAMAVAFAPPSSKAQSYYADGVYISFENDTGYTVHQLFMSPHASYRWGQDLLGIDTLRDGESTTLLSDYVISQRYDVKIVYGDGSEYVWDQIAFDPTKVDRTWITANANGVVFFHWE
jgi:hypothetical protein